MVFKCPKCGFEQRRRFNVWKLWTPMGLFWLFAFLSPLVSEDLTVFLTYLGYYVTLYVLAPLTGLVLLSRRLHGGGRLKRVKEWFS
jgi:hypothetical protein